MSYAYCSGCRAVQPVWRRLSPDPIDACGVCHRLLPAHDGRTVVALILMLAAVVAAFAFIPR